MKTKTYPLALAGMLATMALAPGEASAEEYCREYTRTISVGGRIQEGYGQACMMPDGDWRITNEQVRYITRENTVYDSYNTQPVFYSPERVYYRNQPVRVVFVNPPRRIIQHNHGWGNNVIYYSNNKRYDRHDHNHHNRWDRRDRHDRNDHRGRGRGHRH